METDLGSAVQSIRADSARLQDEGWLGDAAAPARVAAYVAASEHIEKLTAGEVVAIVREGLDPEVAEANGPAVRGLARDVLLRLAEA